MAPWLSRMEREARDKTRLRMSGGSGDLSQAFSSSSSTPASQRIAGDKVESAGASSPRPPAWLSRAVREARENTRKTTSLRMRGGSGDLSQASSSSSTPASQRSAGDKVESAGASSPRPQGQRPQDVVEGTGASSPAAKRPRLLDEVESIEDLVGPSSETREAHLRRHAGGRRTCPRCRYYLHGAAWTATYGSCVAPTGPRRRIVWLAERPARQGGAWALGCVFCASHESRSVGDSRQGIFARRRGAFGGYSVRYRSLQAENISVHEKSLGHKFAVASWFLPEQPVCITMQATLDDDRLLSGNMPQADLQRSSVLAGSGAR